MNLSCHAQTWGAVRGHPAGTQSIKDLVLLSKAPFHKALKEIRLVGFNGVEAFDGDVLEWYAQGLSVDRTGLKLSGVYTSAQFIYDDAWPDEREKLTRVIQASAKMGASNLAIGGGAVRTNGVAAGDVDRLARHLDEVAEIARDHNVRPHFHPHPHPNGYTSEHLEELFEKTSVGICPDLAVLAKGDLDPVAFIKTYATRISYIHLKDIRNGEDIEVGQGEIDLKGVVRVLAGASFKGWLVAELDASESTPAESARAMLGYIREELLPLFLHQELAGAS
jgi:inosose dehydratase